MAAMSSMRTDSVQCGGDGAMDVHVWTPDSGGSAAILLIQEIFGVGTYIRSVAEKLAAAGYVVGAPDVFWRFHRNWEADHDEAGLTASFGMVQQLDFPKAVGDCVTALAHLAALDGVDGRTGVLGFCLGGTLAWHTAANGDPSVCVSYYGSGVADSIGLIDQVRCPTLFHFGNADSFIPNEGVDRIGAAIAGHEGFVLNVENAGHAFDNDASAFYGEAAAKAAWAKTTAFLHEHLPV